MYMWYLPAMFFAYVKSIQKWEKNPNCIDFNNKKSVIHNWLVSGNEQWTKMCFDLSIFHYRYIHRVDALEIYLISTFTMGGWPVSKSQSTYWRFLLISHVVAFCPISSDPFFKKMNTVQRFDFLKDKSSSDNWYYITEDNKELKM